jgi:H+/Cl- antiporter ClcA/CBS domain-containing protein
MTAPLTSKTSTKASPPKPSTTPTTPNPATPASANLSNWLQPSPEAIVLLLAIAIGGGTGLAVVIFHYLIQQVHSLMLEDLMGVIGGWGAWSLACVPILGGVLVGLMRWRWHDFGPTLSMLLANPQSVSDVSPIRSVAKAIAAAISLGTGASLGPEGPSVELGSNIGVLLGKVLRVSQERQRLLLGAGAAAGLAAGFNAPIAGVFFALEVVLGTTFATSAVSVVLLSAVVAALFSQIGLGGQPAFTLPSYEVRSPLELPLYVGLGLFASLVAIAYTQAIKLCQRFFQGQLAGCSWMANLPPALRPVIGGICVGVVALFFPQTLGIGYETIEAMLSDVQISLLLLVALLCVKLAMTAISLGSGLVGGLFAPAMFLGASLGAAYGKLLPLLPFIQASEIAAPPAYAMVGMAAVLAASVRAPLTAILLLFELTRDYRIILPLMSAVGLSIWLIERFKPITRRTPAVQPMELKQEPEQDSDVMHQLSVKAAMEPSVLKLRSSLLVVEVGLALTRQQVHSAIVLDEADQLIGIVTLQDVNRAIAHWERQTADHTHPGSALPALAKQTLGDICSKDLLYAYNDESIADAQTRMATRGLRQLPVVDRANPQQVLGILDQAQIILACKIAVTSKALTPYTAPPDLPLSEVERSIPASAPAAIAKPVSVAV